MNSNTQMTEEPVSRSLRPLVLLVAIVNATVATLLITTASLGASPINSMDAAEIAQLAE